MISVKKAEYFAILTWSGCQIIHYLGKCLNPITNSNKLKPLQTSIDLSVHVCGGEGGMTQKIMLCLKLC